MFVDASAIVAVLLKEPGYEDLVRRIGDVQGQLYTSPVARFEAAASFARQRAGKDRRPTPELLAACAELVSALLDEVSAKDIHITASIGDGATRAAAAYGMSYSLSFGQFLG